MTQGGVQGRLHLAVLIERFDPDAGGAERSTAQIVRELIGRGHRVTILAGSGTADHGVEGVEVVPYARRRSSSVARLLGYRRWARERLAAGPFDVSLSITMAVPAAVLQPRGGTVRETLERNIALRETPVERLIKRGLLQLSPKQQALLALERKTLADPAVRKVVAVSGYVVDQLRRHYGVDAGRIELIPNAAVMPTIDEAQRQQWRRQVREGFGVGEGAVVYLFAAQNPRLKGYLPLLRAVRRLVERGLEPVVLLAGGFGYEEQMQAAAAGVRERVRMVGPTRQMAVLYAAADVTVLPSYYDPSSKVVIESLMMGTPAISTAFNGASDFIAPDGGSGGPLRGRVVADPSDDAALAEAMAELADPDERQRCRAATAGLADELSMARHVDALERVLIEAAGEGEVSSSEFQVSS